MRILLLSQWFDPEPISKGLAFARALANRGHHVEVLTGFPNYPEGKLYPGYRLKFYLRDCIDGINITRVALYPSHDRSAIKRAANYLSFALCAAALGLPSLHRPDVAYVYHPPATTSFPAIVQRILRRVPFVLDVQDLWPDTLAATSMVHNQHILGLVGAYCSLTYRLASRIAVISPGFKQTLIRRGVPADKIQVIYNWCPEDALTQTPRYAPILKEAGIEGRFSVVFAGNMGRAQGLSSVLEAARLLQQRAPRVLFVFVGAGLEASSLKEQAERMSLRNVKFLPFRPATEVMPLLAAADLLLVHLRDDPLFSITIPSKTQTYMAVGRPILMAVRGDAADLVAEAGAGVACPPESPGELGAAIERLSQASSESLRRMGENGRAYYTRHLSFEAGVAGFERLLTAAATQSLWR
jgi:colanic acid biosynthesis glycosyl transferase WcaI